MKSTKTRPKASAPTSKRRASRHDTVMAISHPHYCNLPKVPPRTFSPTVGPRRAEIILISSNKWVNGTKLKYYFFNGNSDGSPSGWKGSKAQMDAVRNGFSTWKGQQIGLEFIETDELADAQVRIGFLKRDGSWSYVGRDIIDAGIGDDQRTMNFGWDITHDPDTILHEIGHTLGFPHEHQNPYAGIEWNEDAVYAALAAPPNEWDRQTTFENILRKLSSTQVEGSSHDPDSIMHYPFEAGLIRKPEKYRVGLTPAGGLSARDIEFVRKFYPKLTANDYSTLTLGRSQSMNIEPGEQRNFRFKPKRTRSYTIHTLGQMDTVMVLFEKADGDEIQIAGDDDSGLDTNAKIRLKLIKGREYIIRIRMFYRDKSGETAIIIV